MILKAIHVFRDEGMQHLTSKDLSVKAIHHLCESG